MRDAPGRRLSRSLQESCPTGVEPPPPGSPSPDSQDGGSEPGAAVRLRTPEKRLQTAATCPPLQTPPPFTSEQTFLRWRSVNSAPNRDPCGQLVPCVNVREAPLRCGAATTGAPLKPGGSTGGGSTGGGGAPDQRHTCHSARPSCGENNAERHTHAKNCLIPPHHHHHHRTTLHGVERPRVRAGSQWGGGGGEKILENVGFYRKTNLRSCPIPSAAKSPIWWGRNSTGGTKRERDLPLPTSDHRNGRKRRKAASSDPPSESRLEGQKSVPFPPRTPLQRRVNGTSKGTPKEGGGVEEEAGGGDGDW